MINETVPAVEESTAVPGNQFTRMAHVAVRLYGEAQEFEIEMSSPGDARLLRDAFTMLGCPVTMATSLRLVVHRLPAPEL